MSDERPPSQSTPEPEQHDAPPAGASPEPQGDSADPKAAAAAAFASLEKGLGGLFRVAETALGSVRRELDKAPVTRELNRTIEDAGREIVRATTNVASFVGSELSEWSKKVEAKVSGAGASHDAPASGGGTPHDGSASGGGAPHDGASAGAGEPPSGNEWPKTREDYERRYGKIDGDWPRSAEEYERRYGHAPKPSGPTDDDPGFTILGG